MRLTFLRHSDFGIVIEAAVIYCDRFSITITSTSLRQGYALAGEQEFQRIYVS